MNDDRVPSKVPTIEPATAIIGWTGLVGQTLFKQLTVADPTTPIRLYNSLNIASARNETFGDLYVAAMPAEKWRANTDPAKDKATLDQIVGVLKTIKARRVFLISTVDVFECRVVEDSAEGELETRLDWAKHAYGQHRRRLEEAAVEHFGHAATYIIRLPALFGRGLKKNALYDLLHLNNIDAICLKSRFQWYDLRDLLQDLREMIIINQHLRMPMSEPVEMSEIVERFFPNFLRACKGTSAAIYAFHGASTTKEQILDRMAVFIASEKHRLENIPFKLAASNIGFNYSSATEATLRSAGINAIEVVPSKPLPPADISGSTALPICSVQSIAYQLGKMFNIFREPDEFLKHYSEILKRLTAGRGTERRCVVFGAPQNRHCGDHKAAVELMRTIGDLSRPYNVIFCIEPNSTKYNCTWLTNIADTIEFLKEVDHPFVRLSLDSGNYVLEGDAFPLEDPAIAEWAAHAQVSAGYLKTTFTAPEREAAIRMLRHLKQINFRGAVSYEAKPHFEEDFQTYCRGLWEFMDMVEEVAGKN